MEDKVIEDYVTGRNPKDALYKALCLVAKHYPELLKVKTSKKIKRKGYTEHKPIDENDEKFIKKYARYLLFKKIKLFLSRDEIIVHIFV